MDDLHLADRGTLELLEYLIRNLLVVVPHPVLFLLTHHSTKEEHPFLFDILDGASTDFPAKIINVAPISVAAIEEWLLCESRYDERIPLLAE